MLEALITEYLPIATKEGYQCPLVAFDACGDASNEFLLWLEEKGIEGTNGWHEPDDLDGYPLPLGSQWSYHMTVKLEIDGTTWGIDWTARQIDPKAPFPLVWMY